MKSWPWKKFICCVIFLVMIEQAFLWTGTFAVPAQYDRTWLGELKYKCQRLHDAKGQRIIIVGGSGTAFNVDCGLIEQEFPAYQAVNFGLYAALGSKVMLELCLPEVHEGDIVLFMPEQHEQTLSLYFDGRNMIEALDGTCGSQFRALRLLQRLDVTDLETLADELPVFSFHKFQYWIAGSTPDPQTIYARSSFDAYGDVRAELVPANIMDGGYDANTPISYDASSLDQEFTAYLNRYADQIEGRGGRFLFVFGAANARAAEAGAEISAPHSKAAEAGSKAGISEHKEIETVNANDSQTGEYDENAAEDYLDRYAIDLSDLLNFPVVGDPHNAVMDAGWFYDTNYHLNAAGKQLYTRNLIRTLKAYLGITTATNIEVPAMPQAIAAGESSDMTSPDPSTYNLADMNLFTWEVTVQNGQENVVLTGLTSEGRQKEELVIPAYVEVTNRNNQAAASSNDDNSAGEIRYLPVRRLSSAVLSGDTAIRTISVPDTISFIEDNAFQGCTRLSEIKLENTDPSSISIGQNLLEGTSAMLLVPEESLSSYLTDYNFSQYAARIHGY